MLYGSAKAKRRRFSQEIRARERWAQASERDRRSAVSPTSEMRASLITSRENGAKNLTEAGVLRDAYILRPSVIRKNTSTPAAGYAGLASW